MNTFLKFVIAGSAAFCFLSGAVFAQEPVKKNLVVIMKTNRGTIEIELFSDKAPATVTNFLSYVTEVFYDNTIFHRVIDGFMIQGGGFTVDMAKKPTKPPIKNEAGNGLLNDRGTVAMARTQEINSATSQFFINHKNNDFLNHKDNSARGFGYCVFGRVIKGMDVVDKIAATSTSTVNTVAFGKMENVPVKPIIIESIRVKE
ncbi:peptidyl-prolyl cis-trans isomerase [bacterium]|nr:peptidyl-prolyl cis-trans isomerase [bacterium]